MRALLVANRGEIAVRIVRAAREAEIRTVAVHAGDDAGALHVRSADAARALPANGPAAYLDAGAILDVAVAEGCDAIHPGYGFLSERADFARACAERGVTFVGPSVEVLALCGDKSASRELAVQLGVAVLPGTGHATSLDEAAAFLDGLGGAPMIVKAVLGGGGRGMRVVRAPDELAEQFERCQSEALAAFGASDVYVERYVDRPRHLEVQVVGDGTGAVAALGTRECSLQRRHQKLVELAPALTLPADVTARAVADALTIARGLRLDSLATVELLVVPGLGGALDLVFMETNARLQVEHTVTEEVTGRDLVDIQLALAGGASLADVGLRDGQVVEPRGAAVQVRINAESVRPDGSVRPETGRIEQFELPSGRGVRVDTCGFVGLELNARYDSLLAKLIVSTDHAASVQPVLRKVRRALGELHIGGVATNAPFLAALLDEPDVLAGEWTTQLVDERAAGIAAGLAPVDRSVAGPVFDAASLPSGSIAVPVHLTGTIVAIDAEVGAVVRAGHPLLVVDAMKMEHVVAVPAAGTVRGCFVALGDTVSEGDVVVVFEPHEAGDAADDDGLAVDLDRIRPDLAEVLERRALLLDEARPEALAKRHRIGKRTVRENVDDLCDEGSLIEYAGLAVASRRMTTPLEQLIRETPADGLVTATATVNAEHVGAERAAVAVLAYDYTVFAGTQGHQNHRKHDRIFELAERLGIPMVIFGEGGGGRPGDTDGRTGMDNRTFQHMARLSGRVPTVGIASGRCFAGNAALMGCCDVIIATADTSIGMGGPVMVEGGGLGVFPAEEIGPMSVQVPNGVVDIAVADEVEAVAVAKRYLSYFQGPLDTWEEPDQRRLRHVIPEQRLRAYDVRAVLDGLFDVGSVLELRPDFGQGMITAFARLAGRPVGVIANNPAHLAGAITSDGADKAARHMGVCNAFGLPIVMFCDTPGIMVGPEAERTGLVRHAARVFLAGSRLVVPTFSVVLRKAYGLGAMAMAAGTFRAPDFIVSWPTGEFGGMGLEGHVRLGYRKELEAIADPAERQAFFDRKLAALYATGKALSAATHFDIDDVIDPADTRAWLVRGLGRHAAERVEHGHLGVDTW